MSLQVNHKAFFDGYRPNFGVLTQPLVEAMDDLLLFVAADPVWSEAHTDGILRRQLAYVLATIKHETAHTMLPIDEFGTTDRFDRLYGPPSKKAKELGNTRPGDGSRYHGRGYVQITGRNNYRHAGSQLHIDLENNPELTKEKSIAYKAAVTGMQHAWFTGRKLSDFINEKKVDFVNARRIINGLDRAEQIADMARRMDDILRVCLVDGSQRSLKPRSVSARRIRV